MVKVYKWPPVGVLSSKWTTRKPTAVSQSLVSGAFYSSSMTRERIAASIKVGGWSFDYTGHGYMETLKELLDGGRNLVRLDEIVEPYMPGFNEQIGQWPQKLEWRGNNYEVLTWRNAAGGVITWTTGQLYVASVQTDSRRYLRVKGLTPGQVVARPGQRMVAVRMPDGPHEPAMATQRVVADRQGNANIRLHKEVPTQTTHAVLRWRNTGAFRVEGPMPEVDVEVNREPIWDWKFIQVFADEVQGGFVEENPW